MRWYYTFLSAFLFLSLLGSKLSFSETLDEVLARVTTQVRTCPELVGVDECKAVCPKGFKLKNPMDALGYYSCQSEKDKNLVCNYQNKICLIKKDELLQKAIDYFKKQVDLQIKSKEPLTMFIIRIITLDPEALEKVKDQPRYEKIRTYAKGVEEAFKVIVDYALILAVMVGLATTSFKTFEAIRLKMQSGKGEVSILDAFTHHGKFTLLKGFLALSFFALPWVHTDANGNTTLYPLSMDFYRKILLWGDALAEKVGEVFLDVYFKASMKNLLSDVLWVKDYYELRIAELENSIEQTQNLIKKCYQIYDTGGKRFKDLSEDQLANLPTKIDISNNPYAPTPYYCAGSDIQLSLYERKIKALKEALRVTKTYILAILTNKNYWNDFYKKIYMKYKELGWIVLPLTTEYLQKELTDIVEKKIESNKEEWERFKEALMGYGVTKKPNGELAVFDQHASPISESYKMKKVQLEKEQNNLEPNLIAEIAVLLSLPPGSMIFTTLQPLAEKLGDTFTKLIPVPGLGFVGKFLGFLSLGNLGAILENMVAITASVIITYHIVSLLPKLAILLASLARLLSLMVYIAELTIVMPFKVLPVALDRPWQEVFWAITNKVIFISLIPATVLFASFFGVALLDVGDFLFLYIPQQLLQLDNNLHNSIANSFFNSLIYAFIWWTTKVLLAILLALFVWKSPEIINEWLGSLIGTRLHKTVGEEEIEEKQRRFTRF